MEMLQVSYCVHIYQVSKSDHIYYKFRFTLSQYMYLNGESDHYLLQIQMYLICRTGKLQRIRKTVYIIISYVPVYL